jgi:hypothetical protein
MTILANRKLAYGSVLLVAASVLSACGSGTSHHAAARGESATTTSSADSVAEPNAAIVRIGGNAITKAVFARTLAYEIKSEGPGGPVPPDFTACVKHLQATSAASGLSGSKKPSVATLKSECQQRYQTLVQHALDPLISQVWVIRSAAEAGVHVSDRELNRSLKEALAGQPRAQAERELALSGRTWADFVRATKVQLLGERIRRILIQKTKHFTQAQMVSYYNTHKQLFDIPKRRDLEIARAGTEAEALKIKREIASGKSFASVVSTLPLGQPVDSRKSLVLGYEPGYYRQVTLDHAIFAAKPNVLSGPVKISLGYYVFEVKRTHPPRPSTLAQVQTKIRRELPKELYKEALVAFVRIWRARWTARTNCQPSYVVPKCRQFKVSGGMPPKEDPYTLN